MALNCTPIIPLFLIPSLTQPALPSQERKSSIQTKVLRNPQSPPLVYFLIILTLFMIDSYCDLRCPDASYSLDEWKTLSRLTVSGASFSLVAMIFLIVSCITPIFLFSSCPSFKYDLILKILFSLKGGSSHPLFIYGNLWPHRYLQSLFSLVARNQKKQLGVMMLVLKQPRKTILDVASKVLLLYYFLSLSLLYYVFICPLSVVFLSFYLCFL